MSLRLRSAFPVLLTLACSSPKPPESNPPALVPPVTTDAPTPTGEATLPAATDTPAATDAPATAPAPAVETLFVKHERGPCEAEGARECLQVRNSESEAWRNLYGSIDGFAYEPSYAYELRVEITPIKKPPSDAPSLKYKLLEVVSKRKNEK
jgi:hypothetical protein